MKLLAYIDSRIASVKRKGTSTDDISACRTAVAAYLRHRFGNAEGFDILRMAVKGRVEDYREFLTDEYPALSGRSKISPYTAQRHLKTLRAIMRHAVADGIFPDIDIFRDMLAGEPECRRRGVKYTSPAAPLHKALTMRLDRVQRRVVDTYLLGLFCGGIEPEEMGRLTEHDYAAGRLQIPSTTLQLTLPAPAKVLATRHRALLGHVSKSRLADNREITHVLKRNDIQLFSGASIFADWLSLAVAAGIDTDMLRHLVAVRLEGASADGIDNETLNNANTLIAQDHGTLTRRWYAVRGFRRKGIDIRDALLQAEDTPFTPADFYTPYDEIVRRRNKKLYRVNNPLIRNLLFVKATSSEAHELDRTLRGAHIFRDPASTTQGYAIIPERQIRSLRLLLTPPRSKTAAADEATLHDAFSDDDADITFAGEDLDEEIFAKGTHVHIQEGPYAGMEGTVIDHRGHKKLVVGIRGLCVFIRATLPPTHLTTATPITN